MFLYRLAKSYWNKKHICLVSEKFASMAQDNGYYFFKHCMDENEEAYLHKKIYYIISKDSPDPVSYTHLGRPCGSNGISSTGSTRETTPLLP